MYNVIIGVQPVFNFKAKQDGCHIWLSEFNNSVLIQWGKWKNTNSVTLPTTYSEYFVVVSYVNTKATDSGNALTNFGYSEMDTVSTIKVYKSGGYFCRYISIGY